MPHDSLEPRIPREALARARRVVVKLGTNVLCRNDGELALGRVSSLIEEMADLKRRGLELIIVSSGSIGLGVERLGLRGLPESMDAKQAAAAVGQIQLMAVYQRAFDNFDIPVAQILLTEDDFSDRKRYLNLRNTFHRLLRFGTVPIVNENDTVSTSEIESRISGEERRVFGDNDVLSALVASKLRADVLIILSDVRGLHTADPNARDDAELIPVVEEITAEIDGLARTGSLSARGRGGMRTKLQAARVATRSGTLTVIARGSEPGVLHGVMAGTAPATYFLAGTPLPSRKSWLAFATSTAGVVEVNAGARQALLGRRASLLFAGVVSLRDDFARGDIVSIVDPSGEEIARGVVNYSSEDARALVGSHSSQIASVHGKGEATTGDSNLPEEFIHRDNIVFAGDFR